MTTLPFPSDVIDFAGIYQRIADFPRVRAEGVRKVVLRMGDGRTMDPYFLLNLHNANSVMLEPSEGYWEFRPSLAGAPYPNEYHAEILFAALAGCDFAIPTLWIACELSDGYWPSECARRLDRTIGLLEQMLSTAGSFIEIAPYTSREKWKMFQGSTFLIGRRLWAADYGLSRTMPVFPSYCPRLPAGVTEWFRWQKWSSGRVDGIRGNVDLNDERA